MTTWQSEVKPLRRVLVKHVREAFGDEAAIDDQWAALHYLGRPALSAAIEEYEAFAALLRQGGAELLFLPADPGTGMDSLYVRDAAIATSQGMIVCRMGKAARAGEPAAHQRFFAQHGIPVLGAIEAPGSLEGGDVAWIDPSLLAVGRGYRTNAEGIRQLRQLLHGFAEVVEVDLPHFRGPADVFHLMSIFSPIAEQAAVVYSPLMSVRFRELLVARGFELIEVPEEEFDRLGCNVLALAPGHCLIAEGNPTTCARLRAAGHRVDVFRGREICLQGSGGPTCLTRPLDRWA